MSNLFNLPNNHSRSSNAQAESLYGSKQHNQQQNINRPPAQQLHHDFNGELPPFGYPNVSINQAAVAKATFWQRAAATILDGIIILIPSVALSWVFEVMSGSELAYHNAIYFFMSAIVLELVRAFYQVGSVANGQTLADRALKIRVITADGSRPGLVLSFIRYSVIFMISLILWFLLVMTPGSLWLNLNINNPIVGFLCLNMILVVGFLWMLWDRNKQTFFDKLAGTFVVQSVA